MIVQGFWAPLKRLARIISENGHAALDIGPQRIGENMAGRGGMMALVASPPYCPRSRNDEVQPGMERRCSFVQTLFYLLLAPTVLRSRCTR